MGKTYRAGKPRKKDYRQGKPSKEQRADGEYPTTFKRKQRKRDEKHY